MLFNTLTSKLERKGEENQECHLLSVLTFVFVCLLLFFFSKPNTDFINIFAEGMLTMLDRGLRL